VSWFPWALIGPVLVLIAGVVVAFVLVGGRPKGPSRLDVILAFGSIAVLQFVGNLLFRWVGDIAVVTLFLFGAGQHLWSRRR
jgi:hypothetical protein